MSDHPSSPLSVGIIGAGAMGSALLRGFVRQNLYPASSLGVSDPDQHRCQELAVELGIRALPDNRAAAQAEIILLAIKPQIFPAVAAEIADQISDPILVSIMAGISLAQLEAAFPTAAVVRTMPNTPALVGAGITALSLGKRVVASQIQQVEQLFRGVGSVVTVAEAQMDAVTALSGSGPGFLALVLEALIDGGVQAGLPRPLASQLALQTLIGTGQLLQQEHLHPALLKDRVTSPGGTTIAGIAVLEQAGVRGSLMQAVQAAQRRSQELSHE